MSRAMRRKGLTLVDMATAMILTAMLLVGFGFAADSNIPKDKRVVADPVKPYFFIVAADPQLLFHQKDDRNWHTTVGLINGLNPDFVIVCGDLTHAGNNAADWNDAKNS